jgi:cytochrome c-type biogenesis protein CcmH
MSNLRALLISLCGVLITVPAFAIDTTELPDPTLQSRYSALTHELRCMQCQNQSIADSPVGLASDLRAEVRDMLIAGKSDEQIRNFMVDRYGEFILFRPRFSPRNAWLWVLPALLIVLGGVVAMRIIRQRSKLVASDEMPVDEDVRVRDSNH